MIDIIVPADLWDDGTPAVLSTWFFSDGETVSQGAVVAEVMREKSSYEILAPAGGTLTRKVAEETEVDLGSAIGAIEPS